MTAALLKRFFCVTLTALSMAQAIAADSAPPSAPPPGDKLASARAHIAARQYDAALGELRRVDDRASADWNNLMGYSLRKSASPDLDASETFYQAALRIDPAHRGALEYSGELYLMKNQLALAEQQLARLDKVCTLPCAEHSTLKKAVERYKGSGGRAAKDY